MKRQSQVLLAVAFVAAGAAGCFKDPVSSGLGTPASLSTSAQAVTLKTGDSASVIAYLKDKSGNGLAVTGAVWTVVDPTVAVVDTLTDVQKDSAPIPANAFTRAVIRGVSTDGGWTNVIVSSRGIADTIRVFVIPAKVASNLVSVTGAALTDTVIIPANAISGTPATPVSYSAGDTLVLNGTSRLTFDTSKVLVSVSTAAGTSPGFIVYKTPAQLKVMFDVGTAGKVMVQHLVETPGNASIGAFPVDTLMTDSIAAAPIRINPAQGFTAAVANNILTITAPAGISFTAATTAALGPNAGIIIGQTATSLSMFSPVNYNGGVTLYKVQVTGSAGTVATLDSISTNIGALGALTPATFPDANVAMSPNNGKLGDTIVLTAPTGLAFTANSKAILGNTAVTTSDTGWTVSWSASTLKVFAKRGGTGTVTATNLQLASGGPSFKLTTPGTTAIDSVNFDFPFGASEGTALPLTIPAGGVDTVYGALNAANSQVFWTLTTAATQTISATVGWFGSGCPYAQASCGTSTSQSSTLTQDIDMLLGNASTPMDESVPDLFGYAAASTAQPESGSAASLPAAQYWISAWDFQGTKYATVYRLIVTVQ